MALESGTYIDDLVVTNPTSGDLKSQGDDHIRLIKATIKASFPNISGPVGLTDTELSGISTPFTGTPTAPTATAGDNSTQIATTAYVDATFVSEAYPPVSGNSGKFLTTDGNTTTWEDVYTEDEIDNNTRTQDWITANLYTQTEADALLVLKAPLASPTLTGTPAAPTATEGASTTQIATTAFAATAASSAATAATLNWEVVTGDDTIAAGEGFLVDTAAGTAALTITLPASPSVTDTPIAIADLGSSFGSYNCILDPQGLKIFGLAENHYMDIDGLSLTFIYSGSTYGWIAI